MVSVRYFHSMGSCKHQIYIKIFFPKTTSRKKYVCINFVITRVHVRKECPVKRINSIEKKTNETAKVLKTLFRKGNIFTEISESFLLDKRQN